MQPLVKRPELTSERLKELLNYSPESGLFTWDHPRSGVVPRKPAGHVSTNGYLKIRVEGKLQSAHRLAVLYMTGLFPVEDTDHIDGNRLNNRWANLRACSHQENCQNKGLIRANKSGATGVHFEKSTGKWMAYVGFGYKLHHLGRFGTFCEALAARTQAKAVVHQFQPAQLKRAAFQGASA